MPTITHLVPNISPEGAMQLSHDLKTLLVTMAQSVDPGPRGPVIRSLGLSIAELIAKLRFVLGESGIADSGTVVDAYLRVLSATANDAIAYWSPDP